MEFRLLRQPASIRFAAAIAVGMFGVFASQSLRFIYDETWYFVSMAPVFVAAALGGFWPGIVALGVTVVGITYATIPPLHSIGIDDSRHFFLITIYSLVGTLEVWFASFARNAALAKDDARDREAMLAQVSSALLHGGFEDEALFGRVSEIAVPRFADWSFADLRRSDGSLERVTVAYADPSWAELAEFFRRTQPREDASFSAPKVARSGQPFLLRSIDDRDLRGLARNAAHLDALRRQVPTSAIFVPVHSMGEFVGALTFIRSRNTRSFRDADLATAMALAERAGASIENHRLLARVEREKREREQILAAVSHDLRNPLTSMRMGLDLLQQLEREPDASIAPFRRKVVDQLNRTCGRLITMTSDLVQAVRLESQGVVLEKERTVESECIEHVMVELGRLAEEKGIRIEATGFGADELVCDPLRMERVFSNLIGNAIKFTPPGGRILVAASHPEPSILRVEVTDTGPGMRQEDLVHVFDRFWQASGAQRGAGAGLGLTISRAIIEQHGGKIGVRSRLGHGTTFYFEIPRSA